ncbi:MAG: FtsX-like permease family protein [Candidatus Bathyarchaeia archaeon]
MLQTARVMFKTAWRSLSRRKFRSALTTLGVVIGISTIVSLMTLGYGMRHQVETTLNEILGAGITVRSSGGGVDIPEYVQSFILQVPGVNECVPVITTMVRMGDEPIIVVGIDPDQAQKLYHVTLEEGAFPRKEEGDAVVFGVSTASRFGIKVNDTVTLSPTSGGKGKTFKVVGLLRSVGAGELNIGCFMPLEAAQDMLGKKGYVSAFLIRLQDPQLGEEVEQTLKQMFPKAGITRQEEVMRLIDRIMNIINGVLLALAAVSLGVGGLGILNTVMMSVHERRREIGMLKAVGAERWHVLVLFLSEALIISLIGGGIGCGLGLAGVYFIQWFVSTLGLTLTVPLLVSPSILFSAVLIAAVLGVIAGLYPSWKAANVPPVEALRYE